LPCPFGRGNHKLVAGELKESEKRWLAEQVLYHGKHDKDILERYGIVPNTLQKWKRKIVKGLQFHNGSGRPKFVTDDQRKILVKQFTSRSLQIGETVCKDMIIKCAADTCKIRNIPVKVPHPRTLSRVLDIIDGKTVKKRKVGR
jgi:transposase